jgi:glutamate synthase domain-containing protein 1
MCGIVGYLGKAGAPCAVGGRLLAMLGALSLRGPDSAGVAVWGSAAAGLKVRVKTAAGLVGFEAASGDPWELASQIEAREPGAEVVSMGRRLEIVKQVGRPEDLEAAFGVSGFFGTHGLGHTRLSTESHSPHRPSFPFHFHSVGSFGVILRFSGVSRTVVKPSEKPRKTLRHRVVAPTGHDTFCTLEFRGVIRAT